MIRRRKRDGNCSLADAQALGILHVPGETVLVNGEPALVLSAHALRTAHLAPLRHAPTEISVRGDASVHYVVRYKGGALRVVPASDVTISIVKSDNAYIAARCASCPLAT